MPVPIKAALSAVSAFAGVGLQLASLGASNRAADAARRQQELNNRRSRRQAIREAQLRRARALSFGVAFGAQDSSAVAGGVGSVGSQLGANLGFSTEYGALSNVITTNQQQARNLGAFSNFAFSFFDPNSFVSLFNNQGGGPIQSFAPPRRGSNIPYALGV